jgi:hypothetical protein
LRSQQWRAKPFTDCVFTVSAETILDKTTPAKIADDLARVLRAGDRLLVTGYDGPNCLIREVREVDS